MMASVEFGDVILSFFLSFFVCIRADWVGEDLVSVTKELQVWTLVHLLSLLRLLCNFLAPNFVPFGQNFINPIEVLVWVGWLIGWCVLKWE
jgi:hypothetical protein